MADGKWIYESVSVQYNSATYATKAAWAKALHLARCAAFLRATARAGVDAPGETHNDGMWPSEVLSGVSYTWDTDTVQVAESLVFVTTYITGTNAVPGFFSVFRHPATGCRFVIIAARGYHNDPANASDATQGFFIPPGLCLTDGYASRLPVEFAHIFATRALQNSPNIFDAANACTYGQLPVCPSYGLYNIESASPSSTVGYPSCIESPVQGVTYTFGYAVKGLAIWGSYRNSQYQSGSGCVWDVLGNIFSPVPEVDSSARCGFDSAGFGYYAPHFGVTSESEKMLSQPVTFAGEYVLTVCEVLSDVSQRPWARQILDMGLSTSGVRGELYPGYLPFRASVPSGGDIVWSSGSVAFAVGAGYDWRPELPGITAQGDSVKGFIRSDLLRFVSILATRTGGTTYAGETFIAMNCGAPANGMEVGVLLGWDASNDNTIL